MYLDCGVTLSCLVIGATGYVGGRLVPELLAAGHHVRVMARSPEKLTGMPWHSDVEIRRGDVTDAAEVEAATQGQHIVYYLVHSLQRKDFADVDRLGAEVVASACRSSGVRRIVYLGGITPAGERLSPHLRSRDEVAQILLDGDVPAVVFRAAVILGSGSASFEMLRYLTERLPVMVTPRWVRNRVQPIAIRDVLHYLRAAAMLDDTEDHDLDIGGPDVLTYQDMMQRYASVAGLPRRLVITVPALTPRLSSYWVRLVTPVPATIATPLIESLIHEMVCKQAAAATVPEPPDGAIGYEQAIQLALNRIHTFDVPTRWSDAATAPEPARPLPTDPSWTGGSVYQDVRERRTAADVETLWRVIEAIGGEHGWYSFPFAWALRGWIDLLSGGIGHRRGRRDPRQLRVGEALDWWRVEQLERPHLLRLRAEMRLPGRGWLELSAEPCGDGAVFRQRAIFEPTGLAGQLYWKMLTPFHALLFGGMARNITAAAESDVPMS